ncbi:hypothetical protein [Methylomonas sp. MgM2]
MLLILKRISPSTLVSDIENFIAPALKGGLIRKTGSLENITIQIVEEANTQKTEFNALVRVEPDNVGKRVIKLLNRKSLSGKFVNISEYQFRNRDNDRRMSRYRKIDDRRRQDRRRLGLQINDITDQRKSKPHDLDGFGWKTDSTI